MQLANVGILSIVLFAGCATDTADLPAVQSTWHGARYETVVSRWGAPMRSTVMPDGRDAHTWVSESAAGRAWYPSVGVFGGSRGVGVGVGTGISMGQTSGELTRCERTLFFRNGQVVEQSWQGNPGFCSNFRLN